ncbi:hypothetical protein [Stenotrophomonas maltophilia]|uniref:hypothetical protein n=1 Tax=Stenotrophomonas maltophilia TaxID=40324 RepID=UPI00117D5040|nr:hypothetical protein [Stenotrophomonas maltophilia]
MDEQTISDPHRYCPDCGLGGRLSYTDVPSSLRTYTREDGNYSDHFGPSRDYECRNCGASFTLTDWEDSHG